MKDWINKIIQGNALEVLKEMHSGLVDMVMTSPPYWGLRDYGSQPQVWGGDKNCKHGWNIKKDKLHSGRGDAQKSGKYSEQAPVPDTPIESAFCSKCGAWRGELGLEPDFNLYIKHLCDIFNEVKRVLKDTGTIWINLGDTYNNNPSNSGDVNTGNAAALEQVGRMNREQKTISVKSLCGIPARFEIEMKDNRGWTHRNTMIWYKRNCMPSSAKDRFTVDFEYLYFFAKSSETQYWTNEKTFELASKQPLGIKGIEGKDWEWREVNSKKKKVSLWTGHDYYFEQQFEEHLWADKDKRSKIPQDPKSGKILTGQYSINAVRYGEQGRNKRCVWEITTQPYAEAHFAVYPEELCITPIKAGCPEFVCKKCGKAREKIYREGDLVSSSPDIPMAIKPRGFAQNKLIKQNLPKDPYGSMPKREKEYIGYTDCGCKVGFNPGIVLDPFSGAGTTCLVAKKLGRNYIGIELKPEYANMSERRIHNQCGLL